MFRQIHYGSPEYEAAFRLRDDVLRRPLGLRLDDADREQDEEQLHFALFSANDELLASVTVDRLDRQRVKIRQMLVAPGHEGQGLGRRLMQETENELIGRGFRHAALNARLPAVMFYRKLGYRETGSPFEEVTILHQRMEKLLEIHDD